MIRKILLTYAALFGFIVLKYAIDGFPAVRTENIMGAIFFVFIAGPVLNIYWEERRKARERRLTQSRGKREKTV